MNLIELHIPQSFPVSCLNRDDVSAPKTAVFGDVNRARLSSQSLKRDIREYAQDNLLILTSEPNCQGFKIEHHGIPDRKGIIKSGLWLVAEDWVEPENQPF